jgi:glycosyltransferase involved in cell wall biosynthesis
LKVWILQTGEPLHVDVDIQRPMRAMNLANALTEKGHEVVVWSSDFNHFTKQHRYNKFSSIKIDKNLTINLLPSLGYKSNVSIKRLFDHAQLAMNLRRHLNGSELPNIALIGYPPIESAWALTNFLTKRKIPVILDVKDAWPDILVRGLPEKFRFLGKFLLFPYFKMMQRAFKNTSGFSAPSNEFLQWCLQKTGRPKNSVDSVFPLTAPKESFSPEEKEEAIKYLESIKVLEKIPFRISFIGSLSDSFDFKPILAASAALPIQFVIAGDGPNLNSLRQLFINSKNVVLTGRLNSIQSLVLQERSHLMIAPYMDLPDFEMSIPNKFYDYMRNAKPILTSLGGSVENLVLSEKIGLRYLNSNSETLVDSIKILLKNPEMLNEMKDRAANLYNQRFAYDIVYNTFVSKLERIVHEE